jgi:hypothetical protein
MNWFWYMSLLWSLKGVLLMVYVKLGSVNPLADL